MVIAFWSAPTLEHCDWLRHGFTTRDGGVSQAPFDTLNLGLHVGDDAGAAALVALTPLRWNAVSPKGGEISKAVADPETRVRWVGAEKEALLVRDLEPVECVQVELPIELTAELVAS